MKYAQRMLTNLDILTKPLDQMSVKAITVLYLGLIELEDLVSQRRIDCKEALMQAAEAGKQSGASTVITVEGVATIARQKRITVAYNADRLKALAHAKSLPETSFGDVSRVRSNEKINAVIKQLGVAEDLITDEVFSPDKKKVEALIKASLITKDDLKDCTTERATYALVIKAAGEESNGGEE